MKCFYRQCRQHDQFDSCTKSECVATSSELLLYASFFAQEQRQLRTNISYQEKLAEEELVNIQQTQYKELNDSSRVTMSK